MKSVFFNADGAVSGIAGGKVLLKGVSYTASGGAGAIKIYDAASATGNPVYQHSLSAAGSSNHTFPGEGLFIETGIFVDVTGTVEGNIFV